MSLRKVEVSAGESPPVAGGPVEVSWMTGSRRTNAESRRGCIRDTLTLSRVSICRTRLGVACCRPQIVSPHTVADANQRSRHLGTKVVDHMKQISGMVEP